MRISLIMLMADFLELQSTEKSKMKFLFTICNQIISHTICYMIVSSSYTPPQVGSYMLIISRAGNMGLARWAGPFSCKPEEGRACCFGGKRGERACRAGPLGPRACAGRAAGRPVRPASSFIKKKNCFT